MRTGRPKAVLVVSEEERQQLEQWARRRKSAQALALRSRIIHTRGRRWLLDRCIRGQPSFVVAIGADDVELRVAGSLALEYEAVPILSRTALRSSLAALECCRPLRVR
jgi:hypothetical protein